MSVFLFFVEFNVNLYEFNAPVQAKKQKNMQHISNNIALLNSFNVASNYLCVALADSVSETTL